MKIFRYLVVKYQPLLEKPSVNIGVIVQSDEEIDSKFNPDLSRVRQIVGNEVKIEEIVFENLENTFKERFKEKTLQITDKETGQQKTIPYTSQEYLEYLNRNLLNNYVFNFNNTNLIEAENLSDALARLYHDYIG